jgi:predicted DCC family thiol-disulfide oxidoreductase YuxK
MAQYVILFDGVCNLCNGFVQFIIKHDKKEKFSFAPLQSAYAKTKLDSQNINAEDLKSVIFLADDQIYTKSDAALQIAKHLGGFWFLIAYFQILPLRFRNAIYDLIGKNRYKWFGKSATCMIPSIELKNRFLK